MPEGVVRHARPTPEGIGALDFEPRAACAASTPLSLDAAVATRYFGSDIQPLCEPDFEYGVYDLRCYVQSGGYSYEVQQPLELQAARDVLRRDGSTVPAPDDDAVFDEAAHWRVLLQDGVDEYGVTIGYWLLRDDDLAAGRFDRAYFEIQH